ncbi:Yip1 family protein [Stagnihabitans tardus]|uniref:Yip1 domain-containing protein n=1 Tax=Stagnihabitans tardus TaxID=2699202 RepID=A0AAE4Y6G8_9RHOB|nr:Yip1 family protein [Stagnihabitans tardus]NBZ85974.1 hypothetical protein [Stagnihabitans tardus]
MNLNAVLRLLHQSYDHPQDTARWLMRLGLPRSQAFMALGLTAVIGSLMSSLAQMISDRMPRGTVPPTEDQAAAMAAFEAAFKPMLDLMASPLGLAGFQLAGTVFTCFLMHRVGRLFGGKGTWPETLILMAWLQVIMTLLQLVQLFLALTLPIVALPVALFTIFSYFFLLSHFTAALHGFASVGKVFGGIIATGIAVTLLLAVLFFLTLPVQHV